MDKKLDRETILARSRKENFDEGLAAAEDRGQRLGLTVFSIVAIFLLLFDLYHELPSFYATAALVLSFSAIGNYPLYRFTGKKKHLLCAVCSSLLCVLTVAAYVRQILG